MIHGNHLVLFWTYLNHEPLLWLTLTVVFYVIAQSMHERLRKHPLINPVLISVAFLIGVLRLSHVQYADYMKGAQYVHFLLGPAIVALAIPLNKQLPKLHVLLWPLTGGLVAGCLSAIISTVLLSRMLGASAQTIASLAPRSATTGIAIRLSEHIGGVPSLTAVLVVMTGITGAILGVPVLNVLRVNDPQIAGLSMGVAGHGIGIARALQICEEAGAVAGLGMCLNGILTAFVLPPLFSLLLQ
jgi:predicted murein hydrolase (TIGR00659 family)